MTSRRKFIKNSSAAAAAAWVGPFSIIKGFPAPDKVTVALIGCHGMGMYNLRDHLKLPDVQCGGICDVDENVLNERAAEVTQLTGKKPPLFSDYRKVLEDKKIDAVIVGTPDHWHCLITTDACKAGKDVYVEKPLANSIGECEIMVDVARKYNRVVQVGQQQRSGQHWQDIVTKVRSGALGVIRRVKTWGYFDYGKASPKVADAPEPKGVNYDFWLGPAPQHAFNQNRFHGSWRFFWEQGGGLMTDWGVHLVDIALWAMNVSVPNSVSAAGGIYVYRDNAIETADTQTVVYDFGNFILEWEHNAGISKGLYGRHYGVAFIGTNGTLVVNREGWEIIAETDGTTPRMEAIALQPADRTDHQKHVANFIACVKDRSKPVCDVEFGRNAAVLAHLGNIAYRTGRTVKWDSARRTFGGDADANALIRPSYREPWKFPTV